MPTAMFEETGAPRIVTLLSEAARNVDPLRSVQSKVSLSGSTVAHRSSRPTTRNRYSSTTSRSLRTVSDTDAAPPASRVVPDVSSVADGLMVPPRG